MLTTFPVSADSNLKVLVDGEEIQFDTSPVIKEGRTLVPIRKTAETLGLTVEWDMYNRTVITKGKGTTVVIKVGEKTAYQNGQAIQLDVAPTIIDGRTLIPLRSLSEVYGYIVDWIPKERLAVVFSSVEEEQKYKTASVEIPVLMYHILIEGQNDSISVDPDRFREHMLALKTSGYHTITDYDLIHFLEKGSSLPENPILITFDDGYKSNYTEAYPILKELGMKATIYVITSRVFEEETILDGELEKITWNDAREMEGTVLIQSHTWDSHKSLMNDAGEKRGMIASRTYLNGKLETQKEYEDRVFDDFVKSRKEIEEKMGYEAISIAYPYGDYSQDTVRLAQKAGYQMGFAVKDGIVNIGDQLFELDRITGNGAYSGEELIEVIENNKR